MASYCEMQAQSCLCCFMKVRICVDGYVILSSCKNVHCLCSQYFQVSRALFYAHLLKWRLTSDWTRVRAGKRIGMRSVGFYRPRSYRTFWITIRNLNFIQVKSGTIGEFWAVEWPDVSPHCVFYGPPTSRNLYP